MRRGFQAYRKRLNYCNRKLICNSFSQVSPRHCFPTLTACSATTLPQGLVCRTKAWFLGYFADRVKKRVREDHGSRTVSFERIVKHAANYVCTSKGKRPQAWQPRFASFCKHKAEPISFASVGTGVDRKKPVTVSIQPVNSPASPRRAIRKG